MRKLSTKKALLQQTAIIMFIGYFATPNVFAGDDFHMCKEKSFCEKSEDTGKDVNNSHVDERISWNVPPNTERLSNVINMKSAGDCVSGSNDSDLPFRISIDGEPINTVGIINAADQARCTDKALAKADIQVRFDPLEETQSLNVTVVTPTVIRGKDVSFTPYSNYTHYIKKAEIRIFKEGESTQKKPFAVIDLDPSLSKEVSWLSPKGYEHRLFQYILRVYGDNGLFDETSPETFRLVDQILESNSLESDKREKLVGYGENNLFIKNIEVSGGIVTINGDNLPAGTTVKTMGVQVPVDTKGSFAYRQILPAGSHAVEIETETLDGTKAEFTRSLYIPNQDWFYIALADLTIGKNSVNGPAKLVTGKNTKRYNGDAYIDGRLAFYTKGKIKGKYLLTASADTKEQPFEDLFSNFTKKDPRYLLKRIDPNKYYQVYGDDSTLVEDAPTQGKFYVKLERSDSHVMWGSFKTKINGTDLFNYSRTLYGANAQYNSDETTIFGENKTEIDGFAADPGSISSLEEFRGTGGSLYYMRGQDLVVGSERLRIEIRDRDSGITLDSQSLVYGQDYEINYIQGRVILREPLESTTSQDTVVQTGSLSGNPAFLVAGYEYTPSITDIDNLTKGGRASHWVNDNLRVGVTAYEQNGTGLNQTLLGADATLRYKPGTYVKMEKGRSKGAGSGALSSANGGFNFSNIGQTATPDITADAYRAEIAVDLSDLGDGEQKGTINAYTLRREDGFSSPGQLTSEEILQYGFKSSIPISDKITIDAKADHKSGKDTGDAMSAEIIGTFKVDDERSLSLAVRHDDRDTDIAGGNSEILSETGNRTDAALKYTYSPQDEDGKKKWYEIFGFLQGTINKSSGREENNRVGLGGRADLTDRIDVSGESSIGSNNWGGKLGVEYAQSDRTSYYANYLIDSDRSDIGYRGKNSSFTMGGKSRYSDSLSIFAEERYQIFDNDSSGIIHSFGLDLAANDHWTWGGRFENGTISDSGTGDIDRTAISISTGYNEDKTKYAGTAELRLENGSTAGDRTSWLIKNNLSYQSNEDWRFLGNLDFAISDSGLSSNLDADFIEVGLGYAYRPIMNDRFNALLRYEYLQDTPSPGQLAANGSSTANDFEQRSHVFSVDGIYDVVPKLAVGGKVGYRFGEIKDITVTDADYFSSQALLLIGRADWHVVKQWDVLGELRYLSVKEAEDSKLGALLAGYYHINQNIKVGAGYNFSDFSDDLTDLDYDSKGVFLNILGKF